jgi:hypothetical protein
MVGWGREQISWISYGFDSIYLLIRIFTELKCGSALKRTIPIQNIARVKKSLKIS